ncbi:MAG: GntR family transcriptional regulator [Lachnospirales bacterium]
MELNYGDHRPIYEQIKEKTKEYIVNGGMAEHQKLLSVRELASKLAINPNTIQKAYKELEIEGYIYSLKNKGYFVAPMKETLQKVKKEEAIEKLEAIAKELKYLKADYNEVLSVVKSVYEEGEK